MAGWDWYEPSGIVNGNTPQRALKLINEWRLLHVTELMKEWKLAAERKSLFTIKPLEYPMILHVKEATHIRDYTLWLRFNDGAEGEVGLRTELEGEVFEPLKNLNSFRDFKVDPDLQTIV